MARRLAELFADPEVALAGSEVRVLGGSALGARASESQQFFQLRNYLAKPFFLPYLPTCNLAARRDDLMAVGGFGEVRSGGDADLCWRVLRRPGRRLEAVPDVLMDWVPRERLRDYLEQNYRYGKSHHALCERWGDAGAVQAAAIPRRRLVKNGVLVAARGAAAQARHRPDELLEQSRHAGSLAFQPACGRRSTPGGSRAARRGPCRRASASPPAAADHHPDRRRGASADRRAGDLDAFGDPVAPLASKPPGGMADTVVKGVSWAAAARLGTQAVQFAASLVLARLFSPADFGVYASLYVITGFTVLFFELGVGASLVHLREITEKDLATAFWINALGGVVFALLLTAASPLVASFYHEPALRYLTPLVALTFTLGVGVCHKALLERQMRFRPLAALEVISTVLSFGFSIGLALAGVGLVSLAIGPLVRSAFLSASLWSIVRWRPRGFIDRAAAARLWGFSGGQLGFNVVNYWGRNSDNILIGRVLGAAPLGTYNRAYNLMLLPVQQVSLVLGRVMFPALSAMGSDRQRIANAYRRALRFINALSVPVLVGMAASAPALIPLLYGPQWTATVPLLQILAIAGLPQCMTSSAGWLYQSQGRTGTMFRMGIFESAVGVVAIVIGLHWGVKGVAVAVLLRYWLLTPVTMHVACRLIGQAAGPVLLDNVPTLAVAAVMGAATWWAPVAAGLDRDSAGALGLQVLVGAAVYLPGLRVAQPDVVAELLARLGRRRAR